MASRVFSFWLFIFYSFTGFIFAADKNSYVHGAELRHLSEINYSDLKKNEQIELKEGIFQTYKKCIQGVSYPLVMLLGASGVGKSTLINLLLEKKPTYKGSDIVFSEPGGYYAKQGHGKKSETKGVAFFNDKSLSLTYCDTEGFLGKSERKLTRPEAILAAYTPYLTINAHTVKGLVFVVEANRFTLNRDTTFDDVVGCLVALFGGRKIESLRNAILLVVTHCDKAPESIFYDFSLKLKKEIVEANQNFFAQKNNPRLMMQDLGGLVIRKKKFFDLFLKRPIRTQKDLKKLEAHIRKSEESDDEDDEKVADERVLFLRQEVIYFSEPFKSKKSQQKWKKSKKIFDQTSTLAIKKGIKRLSGIQSSAKQNEEFRSINMGVLYFAQDLLGIIEKRNLIGFLQQGQSTNPSYKEELKKKRKKMIEKLQQSIKKLSTKDETKLKLVSHQRFREENEYAEYDFIKETTNFSDSCYGVLNNKKVDVAIKAYGATATVWNAGVLGLAAGPVGAVAGGILGLLEFGATKLAQKTGGMMLGAVGFVGASVVSPLNYLVNGSLARVFSYDDREVIAKIVCQSDHGVFTLKKPSTKDFKAFFSPKVFKKKHIELVGKKNMSYRKGAKVYFCGDRGRSVDATFEVWIYACYAQATLDRIKDLKKHVNLVEKINVDQVSNKILRHCNRACLSFLAFYQKRVFGSSMLGSASVKEAHGLLSNFLRNENMDTYQEEEKEQGGF